MFSGPIILAKRMKAKLVRWRGWTLVKWPLKDLFLCSMVDKNVGEMASWREDRAGTRVFKKYVFLFAIRFKLGCYTNKNVTVYESDQSQPNLLTINCMGGLNKLWWWFRQLAISSPTKGRHKLHILTWDNIHSALTHLVTELAPILLSYLTSF